MTQPVTVGTPSPLRYGCLPGQTFYLPIVFVALSRWFCRGVRREKSDGSASHPHRCRWRGSAWWGHIAEVPDFWHGSTRTINSTDGSAIRPHRCRWRGSAW